MGVTSVTITLLIFMISMACQVDSKRFTMNIHEKGERFQETVEINEKAQLQVYKVPAHNNISHSEVLHDFKMGLTIYRLVDAKTCYITKLLAGEPTPQELISNFQMARNSIGSGGVTVVSRQFMPSRPFPRKLLRQDVSNFCENFEIYKVEPYSEDYATVGGWEGRVRRHANGLKICKRIDQYTDLTCTMDKILYNCHFRNTSCFYTISCTPNPVTLQMCDTVHTWTGFMCCDPYCS